MPKTSWVSGSSYIINQGSGKSGKRPTVLA
jgi:hypothetical protein